MDNDFMMSLAGTVSTIATLLEDELEIRVGFFESRNQTKDTYIARRLRDKQARLISQIRSTALRVDLMSRYLTGQIDDMEFLSAREDDIKAFNDAYRDSLLHANQKE